MALSAFGSAIIIGLYQQKNRYKIDKEQFFETLKERYENEKTSDKKTN